MISDVVCEAIEGIEGYLREMPDTYSDPVIGEAIDKTLIQLRLLLVELMDCTPREDRHVPIDQAKN